MKAELARVYVGRARVHALTTSQAIARVSLLVAEPGTSVVVTPNIAHIDLLERDALFRAAYRDAALVLPDGWPVALAVRLFGGVRVGRVTGADLLPLLAGEAAAQGWAVALAGGIDGTVRDAVTALQRRFPGLRVVAAIEPPVAQAGDVGLLRSVIEGLQGCRPDLLILGLGAPKQEVLAAQLAEVDAAGVVACFGAALDFVAGRQPRAPRWLQRLGLEWIFRIVLEPRRLSRRYAGAVPAFAMAVLRARKRQTD